MRWSRVPLRLVGLIAALGVNAWLLATVVIELTSDSPVAVEKVDWNAGSLDAVGNASNRKPIDAYGQILAHPIFFKSREPFVLAPPSPPPALKAAPSQVAVDPGIVLGGVMINSHVRKAYVSAKGRAGGTWTNEGDEFMGWRVTFIDGARARLEQKGRSIDLQLYPRE